MDIKYRLALVASVAFLSLVRCEYIVVTTRHDMSNWRNTETININFSLQKFERLYKCLCKATTRQCSVSVSVLNAYYHASRISSEDSDSEEHQEYTNDDLSCKNYQCQYSGNSTRFDCSEVKPTYCRKFQSLNFQSSKCGDTKCVSIIWKYNNEHLDYSNFTDTVRECNRDCGCSTGMTSTAEMEPTGKVTTAKTTTTTRTKQKTTSLALTSLVSSEETTNAQEYRTAEINVTVPDSVSDSQKQNDAVPIIVGIVVALIILASIAVVAVFLWKRKKGAVHKAAPVCHEYANLPEASVCTKECDATTNVINSNQDHPRQYVNYDTDNCSFQNDHANVKYFNNQHSGQL